MLSRFTLDCIDTPGWNDGIGNDCSQYRKVLCADNLIGEGYNYPELNCCGCRKQHPG